MTRIAIYPGSFDPPTRGHEDVVRRSLALADQVIVAVAVNASKSPLFTPGERVALLEAVLGPDPRLMVVSFEGLLADFARARGARLVIRGLRAAGDLEYELQMALMNRQLLPGLETLFLAPSPELNFISSTLVREVARSGGDVTSLVPPAVAAALEAKLRT